MKVTQTQLTALLSSIGLQDVELVEDDAQSTFNHDEALQAIDTSRLAIIEPKIQKKIYDETKSKVNAIMDDEIRKLVKRKTGIDNSKIKDLTAWEDVVEAAIEHTKGLAGKEKEDIQKEIDSLIEKHNKALAEAERKHKELESTWQNKWSDREITSVLTDQLKNAPILNGADRATLAQDLKRYLSDKYDLKYDEATKTVNLFMKDNPAMPVFNEAGTKKVTILDEAEAFLKPRGLWQTDMRNVKPDPNKGDSYRGSGGTPPDIDDIADPIAKQNALREQYMAQLED